MEFFALSLPLWFHPTLRLVPAARETWPLAWECWVFAPHRASLGPTGHLRCLKNSASWLSCALRKYCLGFVEQQSEMPSIVKEVSGAAGGWTLISTCLSSTLITWSSPLLISDSAVEVERACQAAFFISFLSTLLIAWGTGGEWSFYTLGVFFNTVLLSPLF